MGEKRDKRFIREDMVFESIFTENKAAVCKIRQQKKRVISNIIKSERSINSEFDVVLGRQYR